jgi:tetratricopeptide (TPR) repeat protein
LAVLLLAAPQERVEGPNAIAVPSQNPLITEGDVHYAKRQDGRVGAVANPREIAQAIAAYDHASEAPDNAEARWKLARALYFQAAYTGQDEEGQRAIYEKARRVGEEAVAILERRAKGRGAPPFEGRAPADVAASVLSDRDALPTFFWAAVAWGQWALTSGKLKAARTGAAEKIRDEASVVVSLDPEFEEGGGNRILGRLHHQAPKVPFLTFWVSRDKALENLRRAVAINDRNFVNRHFLAEVLADGSAAERAEAVKIEESLAADSPSPGHLVEDLSTQVEAKKNLAKWKK